MGPLCKRISSDIEERGCRCEIIRKGGQLSSAEIGIKVQSSSFNVDVLIERERTQVELST